MATGRGPCRSTIPASRCCNANSRRLLLTCVLRSNNDGPGFALLHAYEHNKTPPTSQLAGMAPPPRLGAAAARLDATAHRPSLGCHAGRRQPVVATGPLAGGHRFAGPPRPRGATLADQ